jgi:hypothetical protein
MSFDYIKHCLHESEEILLRIGVILGLLIFITQYVVKKFSDLFSDADKTKK